MFDTKYQVWLHWAVFPQFPWAEPLLCIQALISQTKPPKLKPPFLAGIYNDMEYNDYSSIFNNIV